MIESTRDDRKTAAVVAARAKPRANAHRVEDYSAARKILRDTKLIQAGGGAEYFDISDPASTPVFFLDGKAHKKKCADIARYFTPKTIETRYSHIMDRVTQEQIGELRRTRTGQIDVMSFDLAVAVAADIVGLTVTDRKKWRSNWRARFRRRSITSSIYSAG